MATVLERRRHKRFDMTSRECKLYLIRQAGGALQHEDCTLLNLCYGGMRFRACGPLRPGEECQFLIDLKTPVRGSVFVKARIRWARPFDRHPEQELGAVFVESSKGWLGPEENGFDE